MNALEFAREIEKANRRLVELRRAARNGDGGAAIESALAELSAALEELKVAEEELVSQNEELAVAQSQAEYQRHRYREMFMAAPHAQIVTDLRGMIVEANRVAGEMLGVPVPMVAGRPLPLLVVAEDRERFNRWVAVLKDASHDATVCVECGGSARFRLQTIKGNRDFPCEVVAAPLADRFGRIDTIRWFLRDVTEREQARDTLRLQEDAHRKDEFLALLGHELRNPLAAITLAANILTGEQGDSERKRWAAEVVERHADQLRRLVDDLLDVSRASHGKIALQPSDVDLRHVVAAAIESCQAGLQRKGHQLATRLPDRPVLVEGDPARLTQIVTNLVDNAAKYTPSGGRVEVSVERRRGKPTVVVRDNGIGIAPAMLDRIFGAYHQVAEGGSPRDRGLGLGLSLVKELVSLHGGAVAVASDGEGKGATFTVELPAVEVGKQENGGRANGAVAAGDRNAVDGHRILIVDDNADAAELLAETLRRVGYAVDVAFDGEGGVASARRAVCRVAIVDLGLPDLDGFEVCRLLKAEQPEVRVVALTGYSDRRSRDQAKEAGFDHFLVKPLDPRSVVTALAELVARRQ